MGKPVLVIGSKSVSSWSLRPWLFLKHHAVAFDERVIELDRADTRARILEHSPTARVPVLEHDSIRVWESLAICEYAAETFALPLAWPQDPARRALARSLAHEMHAGFADLRRELPFKPARKPARMNYTDKAAADISRIRAIWRDCRREFGREGEWLFGRFGIVDAMYAPVALRFHSYMVELDVAEREYVYSVLMHPAVQEWMDDAQDEVSQPAAPAAAAAPAATQEHTIEQAAAPAAAVAPAPRPEPPPPAPPVATPPAAALTPAPPEPDDHDATQPVLRTLLELKLEDAARPAGPVEGLAAKQPAQPAAGSSADALAARLGARRDAKGGLVIADPMSEPVVRRDLDKIAPPAPAPAPGAAGTATAKAEPDPAAPAPVKIRSTILPP